MAAKPVQSDPPAVTLEAECFSATKILRCTRQRCPSETGNAQVPNIKGVDQLSVFEIAGHLGRLQQLAEDGHLHQEDLAGTLPCVPALCESITTMSYGLLLKAMYALATVYLDLIQGLSCCIQHSCL